MSAKTDFSSRTRCTGEDREIDPVQWPAPSVTIIYMELATQDQLIKFADVIETLARRHGLTNLCLAGDGQLVADVAAGRTLLDIARFENEAQAVLQASVSIISSRSELAGQIDKRSLSATHAA